MNTVICVNAGCENEGEPIEVTAEVGVMCGACGEWIIPPPPAPSPPDPDPRETAATELVALGVSETTARQIVGLPPITPTDPD